MRTNAERTHTAVPRPEPGTKAAAKRELQLRSLPEHLQPKRSKGLVAAEGKSEGDQSGLSGGPELNPDGAERSRVERRTGAEAGLGDRAAKADWRRIRRSGAPQKRAQELWSWSGEEGPGLPRERRRCGAQAGSTEGSLPLKGSAPINLTGSERQELAAERQMAAGVDGQVGRRAAGSSRRSIRPGTGADAGRLSVPREGGQGSGSAGTG